MNNKSLVYNKKSQYYFSYGANSSLNFNPKPQSLVKNYVNDIYCPINCRQGKLRTYGNINRPKLITLTKENKPKIIIDDNNYENMYNSFITKSTTKNKIVSNESEIKENKSIEKEENKNNIEDQQKKVDLYLALIQKYFEKVYSLMIMSKNQEGIKNSKFNKVISKLCKILVEEKIVKGDDISEVDFKKETENLNLKIGEKMSAFENLSKLYNDSAMSNGELKNSLESIMNENQTIRKNIDNLRKQIIKQNDELSKMKKLQKEIDYKNFVINYLENILKTNSIKVEINDEKLNDIYDKEIQKTENKKYIEEKENQKAHKNKLLEEIDALDDEICLLKNNIQQKLEK